MTDKNVEEHFVDSCSRDVNESPKAKEPATQKEKRVEKPFSVYSHTEKWVIIIMAGVAATYSPLTANIYFPAIPTIANAFHTTTENINMTVTVYMVGQAVSPSLWGVVSDRKGRRLSFLLCLLLLLFSCVGLALTPTSAYWLLVVLRFVQAAGSASTVALASGVIADIIPRSERGGFVGIVNVGPMIGPCIGPVFGGILADRLGWRSIFWFMTIATGACFIVMLLFFPETLRTLVGDGSIPPSRWNRALIPIIGRQSVIADSERPPPKPIPNPFKLLTYPDLLIVLCNSGIIVASYYAVNATISSFFTINYPFLTELEIGLCFLSIGAGGVAGTITGGKLLDWQYQYYKRKYDLEIRQRKEKTNVVADGGECSILAGSEDEFPIEKARLVSQQFLVWIFGASVIGYGWAIQAKTSIAIPLVLQFIIGYGMIVVANNASTLIIDLFPDQGSSVAAAHNLIRASLGAVLVSIIDIISNAIKPGWTYTIFGLACISTWPLILLEIKMGPKWKSKRISRE